MFLHSKYDVKNFSSFFSHPDVSFVFYFQAGMQAVRENRYVVLSKDFEKGYKNNIKKDETEHEFYK